MAQQSDSSSKYNVKISNARGAVVGDQNIIYQTFHTDARYRPLADKLYSFASLIEDKTQNFVGRQFIFNALDSFLQKQDRGYFIVRGEPGIGKTALLAQLVKMRGYIHHFNESGAGIGRTDQFVQNVAVQLIARYRLNPVFSPFDAGRNGGYLLGLIEEAGQQLSGNQRLVIVVDALDEAERPYRTGVNVLSLPRRLPRGVYFVVTHRPIENFPLTLETERLPFFLEADSEGNMLDVRLYLEQQAARLKARLQAEQISRDQFVELLLKKSEGNFMYLRHVLPEIEAGRDTRLKLKALPQGLTEYYERHWQQMKTDDTDVWYEFRQPIICFLAAALEPITVQELAAFARLPVSRVRAALHDWRQFLSVESAEGVKKYRIYHASFQDFLRKQDEVGEIDLTQTHSVIADQGLEQWRREQGE
jgi:hypothetical protein